jgi:hypothetical protein
VAHAAAVVLPWTLDGADTRSWAAGWARRALALGIPSLVLEDVGVPEAVVASRHSFGSLALAVVTRGLPSAPTPVVTWQENAHQLVRSFFDLGRA